MKQLYHMKNLLMVLHGKMPPSYDVPDDETIYHPDPLSTILGGLAETAKRVACIRQWK